MAITYPEFSLELAPPGQMTAPNIVGGSIESGRSLAGIAGAVDITGGGIVTVKYASIQLGNASAAALRYWSRLAFLNGGVRSIIVPLLTDFVVPVPDGVSVRTRVPFSDNAAFSDQSLFSQPAVRGRMLGGRSLNAGTIDIAVLGGQPLQGGEWFGLLHLNKDHRAYMITDVDSMSIAGDGVTRNYTVGIRPTLRQATVDGDPMSFVRPKCLMRLAPGTVISADVSQFWYATPDVSFIESF